MDLDWATGIIGEIKADDDDDEKLMMMVSCCQNFEHSTFVISFTPHSNLSQGYDSYPVLQMKKIKLRKLKEFAQNHTAH